MFKATASSRVYKASSILKSQAVCSKEGDQIHIQVFLGDYRAEIYEIPTKDWPSSFREQEKIIEEVIQKKEVHPLLFRQTRNLIHKSTKAVNEVICLLNNNQKGMK